MWRKGETSLLSRNFAVQRVDSLDAPCSTLTQRPIYDRLRSTLEPYQAIGVDKLLQIADSLDPSKSTQATRPIYERLQSKLEPYQAIGVDKLLEIANSEFQGAILGDATGLGKSLPALLAALLLREQAGNRSFVLVVTKSTLVSQWESEIARHFKPAEQQKQLEDSESATDAESQREGEITRHLNRNSDRDI
ncbi:hypothetical protein ACHAO7_007270 [Fusarium culmorum]